MKRMRNQNNDQPAQESPAIKPDNNVQEECDSSPPPTPVQLRNNTHDRNHTDLPRPQVSALCIICAICNFIFWPQLGIPAIIFVILGKEAEKRRDLAAAKSHAYQANIFNTIFVIACVVGLLIPIEHSIEL